MYHLFRSCSTFNCPENFPKLQTIRWVFVMLPSLSIGLTSKYWKLGCQPSKTVRLICSKFVRSKKNKHIVLCMVFFLRSWHIEIHSHQNALVFDLTNVETIFRKWCDDLLSARASKIYDHDMSSPSMWEEREVQTHWSNKISNIMPECFQRFPISHNQRIAILHAGIGCCVPSIKVGDGLFAKVHGRHASWQRFSLLFYSQLPKRFKNSQPPKMGPWTNFSKERHRNKPAFFKENHLSKQVSEAFDVRACTAFS